MAMVGGRLLFLALSRPGCPVPPQGRVQTVAQMGILIRVFLSRGRLITGGTLVVIISEGLMCAASYLPYLSLTCSPKVSAPPLGPCPILMWAGAIPSLF